MSYNCLERRTLEFMDKLSELDEEDDELTSCIEPSSQESVVNEVKQEIQMANEEAEGDRISEKDRLDIKENNDEMLPKVSYETFLEAIVPIGYKFECEEETNQSEDTEKQENQMIEELKTKKRQIQEIKPQKLTPDEIKALVSDDYLKDEALNNRVVMLSKKRKLEEIPLEQEVKSEIHTSEINQSEGSHTEAPSDSEANKTEEGQLYIPWGEKIVNARKRARRLLQEFNHTDPEDRQLSYSILNKLLGRVGEYIHIEPNFKCTYGKNIKVGNNFYAGYNCVILDQAEVTIGDNCIISPQVGIYTVGYPLDYEKRIAGYEYAKPITIGDNVWIGGGSIINPGVTIGSNVVVATGTVVTEDIPDNAMVEGNPAHIVQYLNKAE